VPEVCAPEGERCQPRHDIEQANACCEGLICVANEQGLGTCRKPREGEAKQAQLCERAFRNDSGALFSVGPIQTSLGTIEVAQTGDNRGGEMFSPTGSMTVPS
jgi:hypothetical protein